MTSQEVHLMWQNYWSTGRSDWHLSGVNDILTHHLDKLTGGLEPSEAGTILVPLSGKSMDVLYLYHKGYKVLAIEFCEEVATGFLADNKVSFTSRKLEGFGTIHSTPDGRLSVLCGDVLEVTPELLSECQVTMIWDRAAIVAIEKQDLPRYAQVMKELLVPGGRCLMVVLHFNQLAHTGPPYDVPPEVVQSLFEDKFDIELLQTVEEGNSLKQYLVIPDNELVYLMTARCGHKSENTDA